MAGWVFRSGSDRYADNITSTVLEGYVTISDSMESGADSLSFQAYIYNQEFVLRAGMEIRVFDQITTVAQEFSGGATAITVNDVSNIDVGDVLVLNAGSEVGLVEYIRVESIDGLVLNVTRGITGTSDLIEYTYYVGTSVSTIEFGGNLLSVGIEGGSGNLSIYSCDAKDYVYMLDRRLVNKVYSEKPISTGIKRTDVGKDADDEGLIEEILYDLRADANNDKGIHGIDIYYDTFYDNISTTNIEVGPSIKQQTFKRVQASQALTTEMGGFTWWIDFAKQIHVQSIANRPATQLPIESGDYILDLDNNTDDYSNLVVETSINGVGTKAVIADPLVKSTNRITQDHHWGSTQDGSTNGWWIETKHRPFSLLDVVELKIVRHDTTTDYIVGDGNALLELENVHRSASDDTVSASGGSYKAWIDLGPVNSRSARIRFASDSWEDYRDVVWITYNYMEKNDHFARGTEAQENMRLLTGGDGVHEFVYSRGNEITAASPKDMDNIASAILYRKSKILFNGAFESLTKGWKAGQVFRIRWLKENIDETVWVVNVGKSIMSAQDIRDGDNIMRHHVAFANVPRGVRGA